jgi:hypothetical protein
MFGCWLVDQIIGGLIDWLIALLVEQLVGGVVDGVGGCISCTVRDDVSG